MTLQKGSNKGFLQIQNHNMWLTLHLTPPQNDSNDVVTTLQHRCNNVVITLQQCSYNEEARIKHGETAMPKSDRGLLTYPAEYKPLMDAEQERLGFFSQLEFGGKAILKEYFDRHGPDTRKYIADKKALQNRAAKKDII